MSALSIVAPLLQLSAAPSTSLSAHFYNAKLAFSVHISKYPPHKFATSRIARNATHNLISLALLELYINFALSNNQGGADAPPQKT